MISLVQECQLVIVKMLEPKEIVRLYESCDEFKQMIIQLNKYFPFTIESKSEVGSHIIHWFRSRNIDFVYFRKKNGDKVWYKNGVIHRDNGLPAVIFSNGLRMWYQFGEIIK
jgi:hypothetical protein